MKWILLKWPILACQIQNPKAFKIRVLGVKYHWKSKKQSNFNISSKAFFEYRTSKKDLSRLFFESHFLVYFPLQILCKILVRISPKKWKKAKIVNFQTQITFYLCMRRRKRKYEFVSEFYELFENHHHLSDLLK